MPQRRDDLVFQELDGEAVLYDPRCAAVHRFDEKALFVWKSSNGRDDVDSVACRLSMRFDIDDEYARDVVAAALIEFEARDLLASVWDCATLEDDTPRALSATTDAEAIADSHSRGITRREAVRGGLAKLLLAAPLVSTFFATPAYASGPSAHGAGGCKNVGFSCAVNQDCCDEGTNTACQDQGGPTTTCCVKSNRSGCTTDQDCCNQNDTCIGGDCV